MSQVKETNSITTYPIEWIGYVFASLVLLVLLNIGRVVSWFGMNDEQAFFKQSAGDVVNSFLAYVDAYTVTANLIQFLIWFTVGLFVLSAIRTGVQFYQELQDDITIATKYIHPRQFTTPTFVRKVILAFAVRYGCLMFTLALLCLGYRLIFPLSVSLEPQSLQHLNHFDLLRGLGAWLILFVYVSLLITSLKVLITSRHYHP